MQIEKSFFEDIKNIMQGARAKTYAAINFYMVEAYWKIGQRIVMEEQNGLKRAGYGEHLIKELSKRMTKELGKGFSEMNLKSFRLFYSTFTQIAKGTQRVPDLQIDENQSSEKRDSLCTFSELLSNSILRKELTWSHYRLIMRVDDPNARKFYINEAANQNWSVRTLQRNVNTFYYERILSTQNKPGVSLEPGVVDQHSPADFIKEPYIFEFLKIPEAHSVSEKQLEAALIENLRLFLLELGKGFCFIASQYRINTETKYFYIDLVFYNHILKCFVLIDLKSGELNHQDIGQMDMYVRMFDDLVRSKSDNPTIGVILCTNKDATIVKYSVLKDNEQLFATKYRSCLPTEQELVAEIERKKHSLEQQLKNTELQ